MVLTRDRLKQTKEKLVSPLTIHRKPNLRKNDDLEMDEANDRITLLETTVFDLTSIVGELVEQLRLTNLAKASTSATQRGRSRRKKVLEGDGDIDNAGIASDSSDANSIKERQGFVSDTPYPCPTPTPDETTLIWFSHGGERKLRLSSISKIIPGQRTAVFRRYPRPEKDYLSFSLLYNNGERSLDLICKDKAETEVWFAGLKALISSGQRSRRTGSDFSDINDGGEFLHSNRTSSATLESAPSLPRISNRRSVDSSREYSLNLTSSDVGSDRANMQLRTSTAGDSIRISVSSAPSSSSHSSGPDDIDSFGDVYVWGEVLCDGGSSKVDVLLPRPLESNVVFDVQQISCGVGHAALVTRQGEVFTWGEELGGRLGHGIDKDFSRPRRVDFFALDPVDYIACGEYHTCAVSVTGDLFTWGDGAYNAGLLAQGTDVSHWKPKRVMGPLEGLQVLSVACGPWHSALVTSNGKLFTFGDGTFGVLGHGNRDTLAYPREIESLSGLKTIKVACGVWHTAAIVEVMGQPGANVSSKKLFTWGDGDKYRLGHGDKDTRLVPMCIPSLIEYNFDQLACGHSITIAKTTSGHVFTMGSSVYGQLGNPLSDGKMPCLIQDKLVGEFVSEISCGSYHVAVLTSGGEVFTWGKGANGRLGHGDIENRKSPTLVETLRDRSVKSISCGSNFTASICYHKWVSREDTQVCSRCHQEFTLMRKRHNCYNCGNVFCHACSSKKALKAASAPSSDKLYRVCDSCFTKLKVLEASIDSSLFKKNVTPRRSMDSRSLDSRSMDSRDSRDSRSSKILLSPGAESVRYFDTKSAKNGVRPDSLSTVRVSQGQSLAQFKDVALPSSINLLQCALKPVITTAPQPAMTQRPASPYARKPSPPRSATPVFSKSIIDNLKKTNEVLNQEVLKLQGQVKSLRLKCEAQDAEVQKSQKRVQEAASFVAEEISKGAKAKQVIKSVSSRLNDITGNFSPRVCDLETFKAMHSQLEALLITDEADASEEKTSSSFCQPDRSPLVNENSDNTLPDLSTGLPSDVSQNTEEGNKRSNVDVNENVSHESIETRSPRVSAMKNKEGKQMIEQFEPGVYVTLIILNDGTKVFKRVRFSKRRFAEQQAEGWWMENKDRVLRKYSSHASRSTSTSRSSSSLSEAPPPQSPKEKEVDTTTGPSSSANEAPSTPPPQEEQIDTATGSPSSTNEAPSTPPPQAEEEDATETT
ncbi:hypothetical protein GIB67_014490 [Kingdonia uniflora]|uniref:Uncharacterized protein n=1 Tax=Kingdonia uniflora TaxID=39325 RepID=A0A7J7LZE1_9MAGN|nr:hypothetical protein GIB67_014490 [Kingdonia uniflora]